MLVGNYLLRVPHEEDFRFFASFPEIEGPIVDVGANGGQSIVSFTIFCRRARILSFEPNAELHGELKFVIRQLNRNGSRVLPMALGDRNGKATLRIPHQGALPLDARASMAENTTDGAVASDVSEMRSIDVDIRTFDSLTREELGVDRDPEVVKVDVEGFEAEVLRGMKATLSRARPLVMFERSDSFEAVKRELLPLDYQLYEYDAAANRLGATRESTSRLNVFALSTAWREKCRAKGLLAG